LKVLILTSVVSDATSYERGDKPTLSTEAGTALINSGFALPLVELSSDISDAIDDAAEAAGFTLMATPSGSIPADGGYYWSGDDRLHLIHPSGSRAVIDPLHVVPGWSA
jgi:hypothetical protein